jgi:transposase
MGRPYSTDLRERVLRACEIGDESQAAIARRFEISDSAVRSWLRQLRQDGRRAPKPHGRGFRSILDEDDGAVLRSLVAAKNDATLAEYTRAFTARTGEEISESSMCRALRRHGLVVKKRPCGRVSNGGRTLPPNAMTSTRRLQRSIRTAWSSWTRVGS